MSTRVGVVDRIVATVAILVQAVDGIGIEVGGIIGADKASPLGGVVPGVAVVQTGFFVVVIATVTDRVGLCYGNVGGFAGNGAVTPGVVDIPGNHNTAGVVNAHHIAQRIPVEVVVSGYVIESKCHADDGIAVVQEYDLLVFKPSFVILFCGVFGDQPTGMVVVEPLVRADQLTGVDRI